MQSQKPSSVLPAKAYAGASPFERLLALGAGLLLIAVFTALFKGRAEWGQVPIIVWFHLTTIILALVLTPVMLMSRRGNSRHRQLGYLWVAVMGLTALDSLLIRQINEGGFSAIHLLSGFTLLMLARVVLTARQKDHASHRRAIRGLVFGALLLAGFFTFPFGRMLGHWLFSL